MTIQEDTGATDPPIDDEFYNEIKAEIARRKKRPFRDLGESHSYITGTLLPLLRDMAYRLAENTDLVDELAVRIDEEDDGGTTRFTEEDAKKFDLCLQFALGMAGSMLQQGNLPEEEQAKLRVVAQSAEECLKLVEENTIQEEEEGEDEEEEETPPAEQPS